MAYVTEEDIPNIEYHLAQYNIPKKKINYNWKKSSKSKKAVLLIDEEKNSAKIQKNIAPHPFYKDRYEEFSLNEAKRILDNIFSRRQFRPDECRRTGLPNAWNDIGRTKNTSLRDEVKCYIPGENKDIDEPSCVMAYPDLNDLIRYMDKHGFQIRRKN